VKATKFAKPIDPPQYGRRMNFYDDMDFRQILIGSDWVEADREFMLDPRHEAAREPTLACQGDYQGAVSPLRFGRVLSEAETAQAALPLIIMAGPHAKPVRIATQSHWRRREGFSQGCGQWIRSCGSEFEWQVSLRPAAFGYAVYLRTFSRPCATGAVAEPLVPLGARGGLHRDRQPQEHEPHDYVLVAAGDDGSAYMAELLLVPSLSAARRLAMKAAWRDLRPFPQAHAPPASMRWLRIHPWREIVFGAAPAGAVA
jgi:hypothetical protein